ncbi:DNA-binding protein [Pseudoalteromonas rubra]|uniref:DNA-binding protein n=1 Tax=Pseudoalteromonas rubra TaxID=43658 RepID=A0A5S3WJU1_9GAMM|nr:Abi family protein [Pseudoalteromonas rubra]TMP26693.1 DNA-binding protein [Pseudoalteromonas rubra]TMP30669.1 DNA-binding protein [Pseudoalteromonas rubra]
MRNSPKVRYSKPPTTYHAQIKQLQARGLNVEDTEEAEFYLSQLNYYRLAAYFLPFEQNHSNHIFQANTSFSDVLNLYIFDRKLRLLILDAIERFEVSLRTQFAYHLSHSYNTAHPHLKPELFLNPLIYGSSVSQLARDVKNSKEEFIKHLTSKYEELMPPIWAVVELMTLGNLSKWFSNIKQRKDRQDISRIYKLDEKVMTSFCQHLSLIRNHSAHHARLWNRDFTKTMMLPKKGPDALLQSLHLLPDSDRRLRKLYNTLTMTANLMDIIAPGNLWKLKLKHLINQHKIDTSKMGFPDNWLEKPIWC